MRPDTIANSIISVWEAFLAGPYPSLFVFVAAAILVWFAAKFFYQRQIATLKDRDSTKDERLALLPDKFEAVDQARQDLETKFKELEEAVERDAKERDQMISFGVAEAASATEGAMERLKDAENDLRSHIQYGLPSPIPPGWQHGATRPLRDSDEIEDKD